MWKVKLPDNTNAESELTTALTFKNNTLKYSLTPAETQTIKKLYIEYDKRKGVANEDLEAKSVNKDTKQAIYNAYSEIQENGRLKSLRSSLLLNANYCPCCSISPADELDHHLPRSVYHLLAVYSRNLVPMCHKCNNKKRAVTGEVETERFIHVYYEEIPQNVSFFKMHHSIANDILTFEFYIDDIPELLETHRNQMAFQIKRVDLNNRLKKEVNTFLSSFGIGLKMVYGNTNNTESVKHFLKDNSLVFKNKFGLNDWRTVTLLTLSDCPIFCNGGFIKILGLDNIPDL